MNYENRICCFVDILGFSAHIDESKTEGEEKVNAICEAIDYIQKIPDHLQNPEIAKSCRITQFSDSIVISFEINEEDQVFPTLLTLVHLIIELVKYKILLRGGITIGDLIHTDKHLFGPAMVEAYKLESKTAKYPRILVEKEVLIAGLNARGPRMPADELIQHYSSLLKMDDDGKIFIDYIDSAYYEFDDPNYHMLSYIEGLKAIIEKGYESECDRVSEKMDWLKSKLNSYIIQTKENVASLSDIDGDVKLANAYKSLETI